MKPSSGCFLSAAASKIPPPLPTRLTSKVRRTQLQESNLLKILNNQHKVTLPQNYNGIKLTTTSLGRSDQNS